MIEEIKNTLLQKLSGDFEIDQKDDLLTVTKLNWGYVEALEFQEFCNELIYNSPEYKIIIITSHPAVMTMGRGLQRNQIEKHNLVDFEPTLAAKLNVPVVDIKRGGGLTFHHPGQIIVYPIIHIAKQKMKTIELINKVFKSTVNAINEADDSIDNLDYDRPLLGLWHGENKLASMGVQLKRFVSMHGLAINIIDSPEMTKALQFTFPCGLPGTVYNNLKSLSSLKQKEDIEYYNMVLKSFKYHLLKDF